MFSDCTATGSVGVIRIMNYALYIRLAELVHHALCHVILGAQVMKLQ